MAIKRMRIGDLLVQAGFVTEQQLLDALQSKKEGQRIGDALIERGWLTEQQLIEALEFQLGIPHINLMRYPVDTSILHVITKDFAKRNMLIPIKKDGNLLYVAMVNPMDYAAIDDIRMATGFQVQPAIASKEDVERSIMQHYGMEQSLDEFSVIEQEEDEELEYIREDTDAPVIRLVNQILQIGLTLKASDIHIDPQMKKVVVRYRVDGVLRTERSLQKSIQNALVARVKIMASLNVTQSRLPQDGRVKTVIDLKQVDLRVSTLPTMYGEKIVIRILDLGAGLTNLNNLGFNKINLQKFKKVIEQPAGLVLITGPTGSGKSSTLYAALNHLHSEEINIITVEDPVEYEIEGINQVQVNPGAGLTFAAGLRSILRQDPNVVMVGEIRDTETAEIAIRASLTGHVVLSTLHTNSAIATIPRLIDMEIEPYMVVSSITGIVAQRLVRRICNQCKEEYEPTQMERELFDKRGIKVSTIYRGKGCVQCNKSGYKGRVAIHEILVIDEEIRQIMMNNQSMADLKKYAHESGMIFLVDDGLLKAKQGLTTIDEVFRVAMEE
ncbi:GspE/PulE family protein [Bacillus alkalicellulosilyticus]|uniref:GspE/PulE family protein n=1 Tax=Alkalihalobacterium alkalicellulosilyticum TaxID=1912214 RepID=UPI000995E023|nr:ATPase, T2SS/T4P/T4SS family [Bacillus alkalicellulosilyticus]